MPALKTPATRLYFDPGRPHPASHRVVIDGLGLHERMPPGMIRHGGVGSQYPFLLVLFHTASQVAISSGRIVPSANKLVLWDWNSAHCYGNPAAEWNHSWLRVTGLWARGAFRRCGLALNVPLSCREPERIVHRLRALYDELARTGEQDTPMIEALLDVLWIEVTRGCSHQGAFRGSLDDRIAAAKQAIEAEFTHPFSLRHAAERASLSPAHFCHLFSQQIGVTPRDYVIRLRMHRARQLLSDPTLSISRVAALVGYEDAYYFSRLFRRRHGKSPAHYRRQARSPE